MMTVMDMIRGTVGGQDYDCSSLLITAWQQAGVKVKDAGAWNTNSMYNAFLKSGFRDITSQVNLTSGAGLKRGDVLLKPGSHTAMSIGNGQVVQASHNENGGITGGQTGDQIGKRNLVYKLLQFSLELRAAVTGK